MGPEYIGPEYMGPEYMGPENYLAPKPRAMHACKLQICVAIREEVSTSSSKRNFSLNIRTYCECFMNAAQIRCLHYG